MHRLPVEVLQVVFLLAVNDEPDCPSIFSYDSKTTAMSANFGSPPLLFTRVCRHWRDVAHSTPEIWSRIKVILPGRLVKPLTPFFPSLLQVWLAQSGNLPLTICIYYIGFLPSSSHGVDSRLLEILYDETRRWETVSAPSFIFRSDSSNMSQLRTLDRLWNLTDLIEFNAPNLCRARIEYSLLDTIRSFKPNAACGSIRHLSIDQALASGIRCFPAIFPRLETLGVRIPTSYVSGMGSHSDTYSCLESMTLPFVDRPADMFINIFRGLHLPALQKLTLLMGAGKPDVEMITEALAVAGYCNIRVLDFRLHESRSDIDPRTLEPLLSVVQEVAVHGEVVVCREQAGT